METRSHIAYLATEINKMLCARDYAAVDRGLDACRDSINPGEGERVAPIVPVAWLRYTFPVRTLLKNWIPLLAATRKYFFETGIDAELVLTGLNEDTATG